MTSLFKEKSFYYCLLLGVCAVVGIVFLCVGITASKKPEQLVDLNEPPVEDTAYDKEKSESNDFAKADSSMVQVNETVKPVEDTKETMNNAVVKKNTEPINEVVDTDTVSVMKNSQTNKNSLSFNKENGLSWPVNGSVIMNYSMDTGIYFETLGVYKCNPAIIIEAKEGDKVVSAVKGKVTDITNNEETGVTLIMDIGNSYTLTYGQLKDVSVKKGDIISEGELIGKIASPTDYYLLEGSNLYFSMKHKDETVNPMLYLR